MISRVYLQYHTIAQVVAGWLLGILLGPLWSTVSTRLEVIFIDQIWPVLDNTLQKLDDAIFPKKKE